MISKITTSVRVAALNTLAAQITDNFGKYGNITSDPFLKQTVYNVLNLNADLNAAIKQDKAVSALSVTDVSRDQPGRSLFYFVKAYLGLKQFEQPAKILNSVLKKYGTGIFGAALDEETAYIDSLLNDLDLKETHIAIAALPGVQNAVEELREAQMAFKTVKSEYAQILNEQSSRKSASDLGRDLIRLLNTVMFPYIDGMALAQPDAYGKFAAETDSLVDAANALVARRSAKNSTAADDEPTAQPKE